MLRLAEPNSHSRLERKKEREIGNSGCVKFPTVCERCASHVSAGNQVCPRVCVVFANGLCLKCMRGVCDVCVPECIGVPLLRGVSAAGWICRTPPIG